MYIRYNIYLWAPPKLTPEQEIDVGRQIVLEGREAFLQRAPYLSPDERQRIAAAKQMPPLKRAILIAVFVALLIGALAVAWVPLLIGGGAILLYSGGSLWHARARYHQWVDEMIAKYAARENRLPPIQSAHSRFSPQAPDRNGLVP